MTFDEAIATAETEATTRTYAVTDAEGRAEAKQWAADQIDLICKQYAEVNHCTYTHAFDLFKQSSACPRLKQLYAASL